MPHIHEKIDYAADVYIVNEGAVLLRMHEKYNMWLPPGGHVELDEDFVEAALREAKEETGLDVELVVDASIEFPEHSSIQINEERDLYVPRFINRHRVSETHEHISFAYFGRSNNRDINPAPGEKRDGFKWFTKEELDSVDSGVIPRVTHYAKAALLAVR
jgi:ADP-ribose pyrophosphatase YjhB (NUDIX family)